MADYTAGSQVDRVVGRSPNLIGPWSATKGLVHGGLHGRPLGAARSVQPGHRRPNPDGPLMVLSVWRGAGLVAGLPEHLFADPKPFHVIPVDCHAEAMALRNIDAALSVDGAQTIRVVKVDWGLA